MNMDFFLSSSRYSISNLTGEYAQMANHARVEATIVPQFYPDQCGPITTTRSGKGSDPNPTPDLLSLKELVSALAG